MNSLAVPTVRKERMPSTNVNWYYMYQESKNFANEKNNVTSSMIWGCQFDRTLEWIAQTNEGGYGLLTNSKTWGNYSDSEGAAITDRGYLRQSGTNSAWQKNHIYDLAGNATEWTIEADGTFDRVERGGYGCSSGSIGPASNRGGDAPSSGYGYTR